MKNIYCKLHSNPIIILESGEEGIFSSKMEATVVMYDSRKKPYLKKFVIGKCDDNCPVVKGIFGIQPELEKVAEAVVKGDK